MSERGDVLQRRAVAGANLVHLRVAGRVAMAMAAAGVPCALLKGAAFLDTLYPDLSSRRLSDVDVLVPASARGQLEEVLGGRGFRPCPAPPTHPKSWATRYNSKFESDEGTLVEVHTRLAPAGLFAVDYPALFERLQRIDTGQRVVVTLSPEDTVIALAIHEAKHGYGVPAHCREDLRRVIDRWQPDWRAVIDRATSFAARTAVYVTLGAVRAEGVEVPARVLEELRPHRLHQRALEGVLRQPEGRPRLPVAQALPQAATMLVAADSWTRRVAFVGQYLGRRLPDLLDRTRARLAR
jgi:hypothetical protein